MIWGKKKKKKKKPKKNNTTKKKIIKKKKNLIFYKYKKKKKKKKCYLCNLTPGVLVNTILPTIIAPIQTMATLPNSSESK